MLVMSAENNVQGTDWILGFCSPSKLRLSFMLVSLQQVESIRPLQKIASGFGKIREALDRRNVHERPDYEGGVKGCNH